MFISQLTTHYAAAAAAAARKRRASQIIQASRDSERCIVLDTENMLRLNYPPDKFPRPLACTYAGHADTEHVPISQACMHVLFYDVVSLQGKSSISSHFSLVSIRPIIHPSVYPLLAASDSQPWCTISGSPLPLARPESLRCGAWMAATSKVSHSAKEVIDLRTAS